MASPILLTGSAGFVGRVIAPMLTRAFPDRTVVAVVRDPPAPHLTPASPESTVFETTVCDLAEQAETEALVRAVRPGIVVHLAAHASVDLARKNPSAVWRANVTASVRLARALAAHAPDATVLLTSTAEVYGRALLQGPATEATPPRPSGPYGTSKLTAEHVFGTMLPDSARLIVVRPFNHTGPGQTEHFAIPSFAAQIARIERGLAPPVIAVGNLRAARDILDVEDVADAYVRLLLAAERLPRRLVVNVARGRATMLGDALDILVAHAKKPVEVRLDPARLRRNDIPVATATTDRLAQIIAWPPARRLEETLVRVLDDKRRVVAASVVPGDEVDDADADVKAPAGPAGTTARRRG